MAGGLPVVAFLLHAAGALERPPPRGAKNASGLVGPAFSRRLPAARELAGRGGPAAEVPDPDFCEDTASLLASDSWGAGCAWYREIPTWCRDSEDFDDQDFTAKLQCCACGGGNRCVDTNADARDSRGDGCDFYDRHWSMCWVISYSCHRIGRVPGSGHFRNNRYYDALYYEYYYDCLELDDEDFTRTHMCCSCSGGQRGWTDIDFCRDFVAVDKNRNGCDWYEALSWCPDEGPFDDEDFSPGSTCCACGGGETRS